MTGMEHAIEKATRIIHGCTGDEDGAPVAARALAEAGLLAPAPLTEIRAENQFGETHRRWATDWELVDRAEGESWYDAEPDAMPDVGWEPIEPVDRAEGDGRADQ